MIPRAILLAVSFGFLARSSKEEYFPAGTYSLDVRSDDRQRSFLGSVLLLMGEPPLEAFSTPQGGVVRCLFVPSDGAPTAVRLSETNGQWSLELKVLSGLVGYDLGVLSVERKKEMPSPEAFAIWKRFERVRLSGLARPEGGPAEFTHSHQLVLESVKNKKYQVRFAELPSRVSARDAECVCKSLVKDGGFEREASAIQLLCREHEMPDAGRIW